MRAPKTKNYEQLKRPKTNREDAVREHLSTQNGTNLDSQFRLNSQRKVLLENMEGVISSPDAVKIT